MNFGTIILYQSMETEQNYAIQILSFIIYIKIKDFISNDVEKWFDMSNYNKKDKITFPTGKNKKSTRPF